MRKSGHIFWVGILVLGGRCFGAEGETPYQVGVHSDSEYAHELLTLHQVEIMRQQQTAANGTPAEEMWKSELILARWDELTKDPGNLPTVTADYLASLSAFVKSQPKGLDGAWALDHAQFILGKLSQPILTRMEYFSNNRKDREALVPLVAVADDVLTISRRSLEASMKQIEDAKPFDEKEYSRRFAALAATRYYGAWEIYFKAMVLDPTAVGGAGDAGAERKKLLAQAAEALAEWAVEDVENGVNYQAYLLRGKAYSEAGELAKALADFAKAQQEKAPNWVQYQGRYQTVVADIRGKDFPAAQANLDAFKKWIPKENAEALMSAEMLGYRVAWASAENKTDTAEKRRGKRDALEILAGVIARDPRFRDLVYEQVAAAIPEGADVATLLPMQQLAVARISSLNQKGDTEASRRMLVTAAAAAMAARSNPQASRVDQVEATFLLGVSHALLGDLAEAANYNVEFATMAPTDTRARGMVDLALQQIGELRKQAEAGGAGRGTGGGMTPELRELAGRALDLSTKTFGDKQWLYAQGRLLEESGKPGEAAGVYEKIAGDDRNYLEARYRLVALAAEYFSGLETRLPPAPVGDQMKAADELFAVCGRFMDVLDKPPAATPKEVLEAAKGYRYNIWLIETATAMTPAVKNTEVALDRLAKLEAVKEKLTEAQRSTVLRYKMQALLLAGQTDKATAALDAFVKTGGESLGVVRGMVQSTIEEIDKTTDAPQVKKLSSYAVMLLEPLVRQATAEGKKDNAFEYRLIQADMMVKAGQFKEAETLAVALQAEKAADIRAYMTQARAIFAAAQVNGDVKGFAKAQNYFTRILARLSPGSESFWEAWLRVIESMEGQSGAGDNAEIKNRLGDLKGVYGEKFGGEKWAPAFAKLAEKYEVK